MVELIVRMSRRYGMTITLEGIECRKVRSVKRAANRQWPLEEWDYRSGTLSSYAESDLAGGETEEEFTDRIAAAVWGANRAYCAVHVDATYLEELPYESHMRDENDYKAWLKKIKETKGRRRS